MLIDWFTVIAQVLNFLVLVWLMKKFLYRPILDAIDARESDIEAKIKSAQAKESEAMKQAEDFRHKTEAFDGERAALMAKAVAEADAEKRRLFDVASAAGEVLAAKRRESVASEAVVLNRELGRRVEQEVWSIAEKTLSDLASTTLQERIAPVFVARLRNLEDSAKQILGKALAEQGEPATMLTAFDVTAETRESIQRALNETFASEVGIRFQTDPELVGGFELFTSGQKLSWSVTDYLASLRVRVADLLQASTATAGVAPPSIVHP